jgi:hypothetical protein
MIRKFHCLAQWFRGSFQFTRSCRSQSLTYAGLIRVTYLMEQQWRSHCREGKRRFLSPCYRQGTCRGRATPATHRIKKTHSSAISLGQCNGDGRL